MESLGIFKLRFPPSLQRWLQTNLQTKPKNITLGTQKKALAEADIHFLKDIKGIGSNLSKKISGEDSKGWNFSLVNRDWYSFSSVGCSTEKHKKLEWWEDDQRTVNLN